MKEKKISEEATAIFNKSAIDLSREFALGNVYEIRRKRDKYLKTLYDFAFIFAKNPSAFDSYDVVRLVGATSLIAQIAQGAEQQARNLNLIPFDDFETTVGRIVDFHCENRREEVEALMFALCQTFDGDMTLEDFLIDFETRDGILDGIIESAAEEFDWEEDFPVRFKGCVEEAVKETLTIKR